MDGQKPDRETTIGVLTPSASFIKMTSSVWEQTCTPTYTGVFDNAALRVYSETDADPSCITGAQGVTMHKVVPAGERESAFI